MPNSNSRTGNVMLMSITKDSECFQNPAPVANTDFTELSVSAKSCAAYSAGIPVALDYPAGAESYHRQTLRLKDSGSYFLFIELSL